MLVVDNFYSSTRDNIADIAGHPRLTVRHHDVVVPLRVEVDQIYHLACPASPVHYQRDPVQTIKTCVQGSMNMLGLAKRTGAPVLLSSTSEVYGDPAVHPQDESYRGNVNPIGIRSCSFCYVDDTVDGLVRLMNTAPDVTGPVNLGNPGEYTMLELAELVLGIVDGSSPIEYPPLPQDDPKRRCPTIDQARELLHWQPTTPIEVGLARTVDSFRARITGKHAAAPESDRER